MREDMIVFLDNSHPNDFRLSTTFEDQKIHAPWQTADFKIEFIHTAAKTLNHPNYEIAFGANKSDCDCTLLREFNHT